MKGERSLHANVSGVGHHVPRANLFLCIAFYLYPHLLFVFFFGRMRGAGSIEVDPYSDQPYIFF